MPTAIHCHLLGLENTQDNGTAYVRSPWLSTVWIWLEDELLFGIVPVIGQTMRSFQGDVVVGRVGE